MGCATQREGTASLLSLGRRDLVQIAQSKEGGEGEREVERGCGTQKGRGEEGREKEEKALANRGLLHCIYDLLKPTFDRLSDEN